MGFWDTLTGRSRPKQANLDALFQVPSAALTLQSALTDAQAAGGTAVVVGWDGRPRGVLVVRRVLRDAAERGAAILVSSHHLDEVARIAHTITVMHRGIVIGHLDPGGADLERRFFDMVYAAEPDLPDGVQ